MRTYVVHYSEIGTKGKNRYIFERQLMDNIKLKSGAEVHWRYGRLIVRASRDISNILATTPGIKYFSEAMVLKLSPTLESLRKIEEVVLDLAAQIPKGSTFKVDTKRAYKGFPMTSIEVSRYLGERILSKYSLKVNLHNPDHVIYVEITDREVLIFLDKVQGIGGLPVGVSGKVITLISGGIDSPVAAYMMMKRGAEVIALHAFNSTVHSSALRDKIYQLAEALSKFHPLELYMVPLDGIQRELLLAPAKYRMILFRRSIMRLANRLASVKGAKAIVTGDSLSQVASQTIDNLRVIYHASQLPVFTPLIGLNKDEIIELAKRIGTYDISIIPYQDCCTLLVDKHPETRANLSYVQELEDKLDLLPKEEKVLESAEILKYPLSTHVL